MTEKSLKYLSDILMAIELIEDFTKEISELNCMKVIEKLRVQLKDN